MKDVKKFIVASIPVVFMALPIEASSTLLTFDDTQYGSLGLAGYAGFNWGATLTTSAVLRTNTTNKTITSFPGIKNGVVSGSEAAYYYSIAGALTISPKDGSIFDFNSIYLTSPSLYDLNVSVIGKRNGQTLYFQDVLVNPDVPTFYAFNFYGINSLSFYISGGTGQRTIYSRDLIFDNFVYNEISIPTPNPSAVPEPMTLALVGIGLSGIAIRRRQRSQKIQ